MAMYEITFWDGSVDEVEADDSRVAREQAKDLNESGVKKVVLISADDDDSEEEDSDCDENPEEDENPDDSDDDE